MPAKLAGDAICFVWRDDRILARAAEPPTLPTLADVVRMGIDGVRHYLGRYRGTDCIAFHVAGDSPDIDGWQWRGLRSLFLQLPEAELALAGRSFQISEWDRSHRFCGRCGAAMRDKPGERAKECTACGHVAYPRISPAMMVLVTRGYDLLLARANRFPGAMYSALAGFVEAGESIEDCIHREVREEVGIEVRNLALFHQPGVAVPALADDRLHRRICRRRHASMRRRDRRCAVVLDRRAAAAALADQRFAQADRCDDRAIAARRATRRRFCAAEAEGLGSARIARPIRSQAVLIHVRTPMAHHRRTHRLQRGTRPAGAAAAAQLVDHPARAAARLVGRARRRREAGPRRPIRPRHAPRSTPCSPAMRRIRRRASSVA